MDECGHGVIERRAELDGLEVLGGVVDAGLIEGFGKAGDGGEAWHFSNGYYMVLQFLRAWQYLKLNKFTFE